MAHSPLDKIQALDAIEKEIITCVQSAGMFTIDYNPMQTQTKAECN